MFLVPFGTLTANHSGIFRMILDWEPACFCSVRNFSSEIRLWCHTSMRHGTPKNVTYVFFHASWPGLCWPKFKPHYNVFLGGPLDMSITKQTSLIQIGSPIWFTILCGHVHRKHVFVSLKKKSCHVHICVFPVPRSTLYTHMSHAYVWIYIARYM